MASPPCSGVPITRFRTDRTCFHMRHAAFVLYWPLLHTTCMEFKSNNNIVYACTYHVVFCPKYRRKVLVHGVDVRLKAIAREVALEARCDVLELEVMPDHVHLLL